MDRQVDFKELKEIEKQILKGISLKDSFTKIKTIAAFAVTFKERKALCAGVIVDADSLGVIEQRETVTEEPMPYSPRVVAFREGPPILQTLKEFEKKPDLILVEGFGSLHPMKVGLGNYVGVLSNKPCVAVAKELIFGGLEEDKIMVNDKVSGFAMKTKEFANPVYMTPGHNISLETAKVLVKKWINPEFKMPYPLHVARKYLVKLKKAGAIEIGTGEMAGQEV